MEPHLGQVAVLSCLGACALTTDWFVAFPTEAFPLGDGRVTHHRRCGVDLRDGGNLDQAAAEAQLSPRPAAAGSSGAAGRGGGRGRRGSSYLGRGRFETLVGARGFGLGPLVGAGGFGFGTHGSLRGVGLGAGFFGHVSLNPGRRPAGDRAKDRGR